MGKAILDIDKRDLVFRLNSIYFDLYCTKFLLTLKNEDKAMDYIEETIKRIDILIEEIIKDVDYEKL